MARRAGLLPLMAQGRETLRDRDSLEQVRVPIEGLGDELVKRLEAPWQSPKLG